MVGYSVGQNVKDENLCNFFYPFFSSFVDDEKVEVETSLQSETEREREKLISLEAGDVKHSSFDVQLRIYVQAS